jgi:PKD domain-containing protein
MPVSVKDWCVVVTFVLLSLGEANAQNALLAWDQPDFSQTLGYKVSFDELTTDYGISPIGGLLAGSCGCAVPLPFSGGNHTIVVTAYGLFGEIASAPFRVGPRASLNGPYASDPGTEITVDGSGSTSPNGWTVTYTWQWGDGTSDTISSSPTASHVFSAPGSFTVILITSDNAGAQASASTIAIIAGTWDTWSTLAEQNTISPPPTADASQDTTSSPPQSGESWWSSLFQ